MYRWMSKLGALVALALAAFISVGGTVRAEENAIPPGTVIDQSNWQQYEKFMTPGMIALWKGDNYWQMPKGAKIAVGPTIPIPLPKLYVENSEKYGKSIQLHPTPGAPGGYYIQPARNPDSPQPGEYVAGLPFPHPLEGDPKFIGQRVYWDSFYRYAPRVERALNCTYTLDRFGNMTRTADTDLVYSELKHLSDPGFPRETPDTGPYFFTKYLEQIAPEQAKYFTVLILSPDDPTVLDELYFFIPTLRRSLRQSQAARCAPLFGSDFNTDDADEGPPGLSQLFEIKYLGERKVLTLLHADTHAFDSCGSASNLDPKYYILGDSTHTPWPTTAHGNWELRDVYVVSMKRVPNQAKGYCYGERVLYLDKDTFFPTNVMLYDNSGKMWKWEYILVKPHFLNGDQMLVITGPNTAYGVDFENRHVTVFIGLHVCANHQCDKFGDYLDAARYAMPDGLTRIMQ